MRYAVRVAAHWAQEYAAELAVAVVYIDEAHATDEWPISSARDAPRGEPVAYAAHRSMEDRLVAARDLAADFELTAAGVTVVADDLAPATSFQSRYASWPIRWGVFVQADAGATVLEIGQPEEASFDLSLVLGRDML